MDCTYCGKEFTKTKLIGKVVQSDNKKMVIEVTSKPVLNAKGKPRMLKDNEFSFYLRSREEFNFCSVKCSSLYMCFEDN